MTASMRSNRGRMESWTLTSGCTFCRSISSRCTPTSSNLVEVTQATDKRIDKVTADVEKVTGHMTKLTATMDRLGQYRRSPRRTARRALPVGTFLNVIRARAPLFHQ